MVIGTLCTSVVARIKITYDGGSSSVFNSALNAAGESMCTSSMMYTLYRPSLGGYSTSPISSRISSTRLFDAASISMTFMEFPAAIAAHDAQEPQGLPSSNGCSQLTAAAKILATVVLPVPRVPVNR